jgi:hypothetical protein
MKSLAVIIGCWEMHQQPLHQIVVDNIISFISSNDIDTVVLSSAHTAIDIDNQGPNCWFDQEKRMFYDEQGITWIRNLWKTSLPTSNIRINQKILNHKWSRSCISISHQWQLEYLLNSARPRFDRVWYFGIGWNIGVRRDDIGWGHLCESIKYHQVLPVEISTKQNCIVVNSQPNDQVALDKCNFEHPDFANSDWKNTESDVYVKQGLEWDHLALTQYIPISRE